MKGNGEGQPDCARIPPQSIEIELSLIGSLLLDPNRIDDVRRLVGPNDCYYNQNTVLLDALFKLQDASQPIDAVVVAEFLHKQQKLEECGGAQHIERAMEHVPHGFHAEYYARSMKELSLKRQLLAAVSGAISECYNVTSESTELIRNLQDTCDRLHDVKQQSSQTVSLNEILQASFNEIMEPVKRGMPTGYIDLDKVTKGMTDGNLIVIAGRPGTGKTAIAANIIMKVAKADRKVLFFSLEQTRLELAERMLSSVSKVNGGKLKDGTIDNADRSALLEAANALSLLPVHIDEADDATISDMASTARMQKRRHGLDLIVIDYLQLIRPEGKEPSRERQIAEISRKMKLMARQLDVPVLCLAQLNRAVEQRKDKKPMLSDLRESGCLAGDSLVYDARDGSYRPIRDLVGTTPTIAALDGRLICKSKCVNAFPTGIRPVVRMKTRSGREIVCTANHGFLTYYGWKCLDHIRFGEHIVVPAKPVAELLASQGEGKTLDGDIYWDAVKFIEPAGEQEVFDLTVPEHHNFVANDIVVHNSIEQDSDLVWLLYRPAAYMLEDSQGRPYPQSYVELIVAKNRNGETGTCELVWLPQIVTFENAAQPIGEYQGRLVQDDPQQDYF